MAHTKITATIWNLFSKLTVADMLLQSQWTLYTVNAPDMVLKFISYILKIESVKTKSM